MSRDSKYNITVIGVGAMGGGMARALLEAPCSQTVTAYDRATALVDAFQGEAVAAGKARSSNDTAGSSSIRRLEQAVSADTHFVVVVLLNEAQCQEVCFGSGAATADQGNSCLLSLLPPESCVIVCSTVTPQWAVEASQKFAAHRIHFVDCPTSGGPARARAGDLTLMVAGDDASLTVAQPVLHCLGRPSEVHVIAGGPGMGSRVKLVHQLLAGVHIVVAAEALALAAAAGLDVAQVYDIVNGAAGASWMFRDRGPRMIQQQQQQQEVKSMLDIFVKDLDIVYAEAKRLQSPIPLASAALQQFISGQSLGLGRKDDSQVVQVYENVTGKKVQTGATINSSSNKAETEKKEGNNVGELWKMPDGTMEEILEVASEPRHKVVLMNEYVRALRVCFPPNDTTLAHRHAEDSLYFFLAEMDDVVNHVQGSAPACDCMGFGEVRYGKHKTEKPLVHKITNKTDHHMLCIDAEVLQKPPVTAAIPLVAPRHELIKTRDKCRVYKLSLEPGESVTVGYPFFHLTVVLRPGTVEKEQQQGGHLLRWTETSERGDVAWKEPSVMETKKTNVGQDTYVEFIAEWC